MWTRVNWRLVPSSLSLVGNCYKNDLPFSQDHCLQSIIHHTMVVWCNQNQMINRFSVGATFNIVVNSPRKVDKKNNAFSLTEAVFHSIGAWRQSSSSGCFLCLDKSVTNNHQSFITRRELLVSLSPTPYRPPWALFMFSFSVALFSKNNKEITIERRQWKTFLPYPTCVLIAIVLPENRGKWQESQTKWTGSSLHSYICD